MSTRSFIAKKVGKDKYLSIYCHWDGYIKGNGLTLYNNYNNNPFLIYIYILSYIIQIGNKYFKK